MTPPGSDIDGFQLICPACSGALETTDPNQLVCESDRTSVHRDQGIWRFWIGAKDSQTSRFVKNYERVRRDEDWGSDDSDYYRALPFRDLTGKHRDIWRIRSASFEVLSTRVLSKANRLGDPYLVADLGAGNCWLSWRLSCAGHRVAAIDLSSDPRDGLGAARHYEPEARFLRLQASFDECPLAEASVDLAIFNGSIHYATDYRRTLEEAKRIVRPDGHIVIMDSPVYRWDRSGRGMIEERARAWKRNYGTLVQGEKTEAYLTRHRLRDLGRGLGIAWKTHALPLGWLWRLRPTLEILRGQREIARFPVFVGTPS